MTRTVPVMAQEAPGNFITSALWNANVAGLGNYILSPPRAQIYASATQTVTTGTTPVTVVFDSSSYDSEGGHSNTTNNSRYTCQVAGLYIISAHLGYGANATGMRTMAINVNGSATQGGYVSGAPTAATTGYNMSHTIHQYLNVGDFIEVTTWQNSGASLSLGVSGQQASVMSVLWVSS